MYTHIVAKDHHKRQQLDEQQNLWENIMKITNPKAELDWKADRWQWDLFSRDGLDESLENVHSYSQTAGAEGREVYHSKTGQSSLSS